MESMETRRSPRNGAWEYSTTGKPTRCQVRLERNAIEVYCALPVAQQHQEIRRGRWCTFAVGSRLTQCLSRLYSPHVQFQAQRAFGFAQCTSQDIRLLPTFTISFELKTW